MPLQVADGSAARFKVGQGLFVRLGLRRHLLPPLQTSEPDRRHLPGPNPRPQTPGAERIPLCRPEL